MKKAVSSCFIILFLLYYGSSSLFIHTHIVNGNLIVHSHIYKFFGEKGKSPSSHQHTYAELILIETLSSWTSDQCFSADEIDLNYPSCFQQAIPIDSAVLASIVSILPSLRGPPAA